MKRESENDSATKHTKVTKDSEIITFQFSYFVLFANFVVKYLFRFFCGLQRAKSLW